MYSKPLRFLLVQNISYCIYGMAVFLAWDIKKFPIFILPPMIFFKFLYDVRTVVSDVYFPFLHKLYPMHYAVGAFAALFQGPPICLWSADWSCRPRRVPRSQSCLRAF